MSAPAPPGPVNLYSSRSLLWRSLWSTSLAIGCGLLLFADEASLIGVVLVAFSHRQLVIRCTREKSLPYVRVAAHSPRQSLMGIPRRIS